MAADIQKLLDRLARLGEKSSDMKTKGQLAPLIRQLRQALQELENERNGLRAQVSQHAAKLAAAVPGTATNGATSASPFDLASSFRKVIDSIQSEARQTPGVATTIKSMDIEVKGLVQVNGDKTTTFVLPGAGSAIDANSLSTLRVSFGSIPVAAPATPATVTVPDVRNKRLNDATAALQNAGLTVGTVTQQISPPAAAGTVISQQPAAGAVVSPGTPVNLVVTVSSELVTVPNVVGRSKSETADILAKAGLQTGRVVEQISAAPPDTVLQQEPKAGDQVPRLTPVNLTIAAALVTVPNVIGLSLAEASKVLAAARLQVGTVDMIPSSPPFDTVRKQSPAAGTKVPPVTAVALTLGQQTT